MWRAGLVVWIGLLLVSCAPAAPAPPRAAQTEAAPQRAVATARPLTVALLGEPRVLSATLDNTAGSPYNVHEFVSHGLTSINAQGAAVPMLLAEIPSLDRGTWRLPSDGAMETTYRLRPNLRWHDGTPITVEDVVFSLRVYQDRDVPVFTRVVGAVDRVEKRDDQTFDVYWRQPYSFADRLTFREFTVLPRHLLEPVLDQGATGFANAPYWGDGFVGSGPYRIQEWSRGSHMDLVAFEGYFLGKPKTERLILRFIPDENTVAAQILAGELDLALQGVATSRAADLVPRVRQTGVGDFTFAPSSYRHWTFQYANHPSAAPLRDVRVRRALVHALDRVPLAEVATAGLSPVVDSWIPADDPRLRDAEPYITKYPHNPARALALFAEAGWTRGADGMLRDSRGQALACEIRGADEAGSVGAQQWKALGIETSEAAIPANLLRDAQWRATFPCIEESARPLGLAVYTHLQQSNVMSAENGWRGTNRSGWSHPDLDRAIDRFLATPLERDRLQAEREMLRVATTELPLIPLYISVTATYVARRVTGWEGAKRGTMPDSSESWNAYQWQRR